MNSLQYKTTVGLGTLCVALSVAIIIVSKSNMTLQDTIQLRQQQLNNSVLGPQAQQITGNILQDMAATSAKNEKMRKLLAKYGYNISRPAPAPAPVQEKEEK